MPFIYAIKLFFCINELTLFLHHVLYTACGNSSVGRAQPCQGWGREFESRFPLQNFKSLSRMTGAFLLLILLYFLISSFFIYPVQHWNSYHSFFLLWPRCDHGVPTTIKMVLIDLKCPQSITTFRAFIKVKKISLFSSKQSIFFQMIKYLWPFHFLCDHLWPKLIIIILIIINFLKNQ